MDSYLSPEYQCNMKCYQPCPGFELVLPCPFFRTRTITPRVCVVLQKVFSFQALRCGKCIFFLFLYFYNRMRCYVKGGCRLLVEANRNYFEDKMGNPTLNNMYFMLKFFNSLKKKQRYAAQIHIFVLYAMTSV